MPDDELKTAYQVFKSTNSDEVVLSTLKKTYGDDIKILKKIPEDIFKQVFKKEDKATNKTTPTLHKEQVKESIKESPNAIRTVMRPDAEVIEKKSHLFSDLKYDASIDKLEAKKKLNNGDTFSLIGDTFDKAVGISYKKQTGNATWKSGIEYEPLDEAIKLTSSYQLKNQSYNVKLYLDEDNYGINIGCRHQLDKNSKIAFTGSVFKSDSAIKLEYQSKDKQGNKIALGIYGSTQFKEIGATLKITTF